jgi:hypothetical protein
VHWNGLQQALAGERPKARLRSVPGPLPGQEARQHPRGGHQASVTPFPPCHIHSCFCNSLGFSQTVNWPESCRQGQDSSRVTQEEHTGGGSWEQVASPYAWLARFSAESTRILRNAAANFWPLTPKSGGEVAA